MGYKIVSKDKIKVLIVEDHALTRFGLKTTLETVNFIQEIFEAEMVKKLLKLPNKTNPK
jgi:DNA-binding NarL/FixJ family response regulator